LFATNSPKSPLIPDEPFYLKRPTKVLYHISLLLAYNVALIYLGPDDFFMNECLVLGNRQQSFLDLCSFIMAPLSACFALNSYLTSTTARKVRRTEEGVKIRHRVSCLACRAPLP
jgi:hypothetical protein